MTDDTPKPVDSDNPDESAAKPAAAAPPSPNSTSASPEAPARPQDQTGTTGQATPVGENRTTLDGTPAATPGAQTPVDEPSASPPAEPPKAGAPEKPSPRVVAAEGASAPETPASGVKPPEAAEPLAAEPPAAAAPTVEKPAPAPRAAAPVAERPAAPAEKPAPPPKPTPAPVAPDPPIIAELQAEFGEAIIEAAIVDARPTFVVNRDRMVEFAAAVRSRGFDYPACISGVDWPDSKVPENSFREAVYHLRSMKTGDWVVLKARCPSGDPWLNSLYSVYRNADWNEREIYDLFGIEFRGHPDLRRILMPEDWTGHPLLKSYRMSTYYSPAGNERQK